MRARAVVGLLLVSHDRVRSRPRRPPKVSAMLGPLWSGNARAVAVMHDEDSSAGLQRRRHIGETSGDVGAGEVLQRQAPGRAFAGDNPPSLLHPRRAAMNVAGPPGRILPRGALSAPVGALRARLSP